ncbi:unnamed protein product [Amoebophrya sp. A25]|nr:unnamed protein product [Amoebophrya sp. A25]|eukprot:GSA25T00011557001.1
MASPVGATASSGTAPVVGSGYLRLPTITNDQATTLVPFPASYMATTPAPGMLPIAHALPTTIDQKDAHYSNTYTIAREPGLLTGFQELHTRQHGILIGAIGAMCLSFVIPKILARFKLCGLGKFVSRHMGQIFLLLAVVNLFVFGLVIASLDDVSVNSVFWALVAVAELSLSNISTGLQAVGGIVGLFLVLNYKDNIIKLVGLEHHPLVNAEFKDLFTCFSMHRFRPVEISIHKINDLPTNATVFQAKSRPLFCHIQCGKYNEARNTRVKEVVAGEDYLVRERIQFNYDPEDLHSFRLLLSVQRQEVVGQDAAMSILPAAGAMMGSAALPLYPVSGVVGGAAVGLGAASAFGDEIARLELSAGMINDMLAKDDEGAAAILNQTTLGGSSDGLVVPGQPRGSSATRPAAPSATALQSTKFDSAGIWHTLSLVPMGEVQVRCRFVDEEEDDDEQGETLCADIIMDAIC